MEIETYDNSASFFARSVDELRAKYKAARTLAREGDAHGVVRVYALAEPDETIPTRGERDDLNWSRCKLAKLRQKYARAVPASYMKDPPDIVLADVAKFRIEISTA